MNEGMFLAIRNYLEELASLGRQMLAEQKQTNELLNEIRLGVNRTDGRAKDIAEAVQNEIVSMLEGIDNPPDARFDMTVEGDAVRAKLLAEQPKTAPKKGK